jgi:hypothetical protein
MRPDAVHQRGNFGVVGLTTCDLANYLTLDLFPSLEVSVRHLGIAALRSGCAGEATGRPV